MSRLSERVEDIAMIAATAMITLVIQRQLQSSKPEPQIPLVIPADAPPPQLDYSARIAEPDRGRDSAHPLQIPRRGWRDIFWRFYQRTNEDRLLATAAGVVFYGLLAVFPTITALVSLYGLFADPKTIGDNLQSLALMLPEGSFQIVQDQIGRVLSKGNAALGTTFLFGLALALWSANAGVKAIIDALNVVYGETEKRGFFQLNALSLLFTISGIAALLLMVGAVVALPIVLNTILITEEGKSLLQLARWPILFVVLLLALGLLYRFGPSRLGARWEWLSIGTLFAAILWIAGSSLLSWYLSRFGDYDATYGSLGAAIGLMMWMWMSAIIVLCGAELNSEIEHQTAEDTTIGPRKPLGRRGAAMANTVGAAQD
jgi:membrane protein